MEISVKTIEQLEEEVEMLKSERKIRESWLERKVEKLEQENQELKKVKNAADSRYQVLMDEIVSSDSVNEFIEGIQWKIDFHKEEYPNSDIDFSKEEEIIDELYNESIEMG